MRRGFPVPRDQPKLASRCSLLRTSGGFVQIGSRVTALCLVAIAMLTGCAAAPSPTTTTAWRDPDFKGPRFTKIFVIGLSAQSLTDQRGFENVMVSALQSIGVSAVPGWRYVPTDR